MAQRISSSWKLWAATQWVDGLNSTNPNPPLPLGEPGPIAGVCELTLSGDLRKDESGVSWEATGDPVAKFQSSFVTVLSGNRIPPVTYGVLAGSSSLAIASTPSIGAVVSITGTAPMGFLLAGTQGGIGALAGAAEQTFQEAGNISAIVSIAGTVSLIFVPLVPFPPTSIAGAASLVFDSQALFTTKNPIVGVAAGVFQQGVTPLLGATKPVAGTAAIAFSFGNPVLGITGSGGIGAKLRYFHQPLRSYWFEPVTTRARDTYYRNGTVDLAIGATAALVGAGGLSGVSAISFASTTGSVTGKNPIAGTADLTFAGVMGSPGQASGIASLTFDANIYNSLVGQCNITTGGSAVLIGTGNLQASVPIVFTPVASLATFGMFGQINLSFNAMLGQIFRGIGAKLLAGFVTRYPFASFDYMQPQNVFTTSLNAIATPIVFTPTATLTAVGTLAGATSLVFGSIVSINGAASGTADLTFSLYATPRADGALAGIADFAFTEIGTLGVSIPGVGTTDMQFRLLGRLHRKGSWIPDEPKDDNWTRRAPKTGSWTPEAVKNNFWIKKTGT